MLITALRSLRRSPAFTAIAVGSLALALGLTTAVFSVIDAFRHPQSAFHEPERLFGIYGRGDGASRTVTNVDRIRALDGRLSAADGMAFSSFWYGGPAQAGTRSRYVQARAVSGNYFAIAGVRPFLGRLFTEASADDDANVSVVISHRLWRQLFNSETRLERLSLTMGTRTLRVVGVLPPVLGNERSADVYVAMRHSVLESATDSRGVVPMVRLRDGMTYESLVADLNRASQYLASVHGEGRWPFRFVPLPLKPDPLELRQIHWVLIAAALSVLLIACANLANLVLARGLARQRDMAVRMSLGARRLDVVLEILGECVLLALAGATLGLLVGYWGVEILHARVPDRVPYLGALDPLFSWRVVALSTAAAIASAVLFGIFPALRLSGIRLSERLQDNAGTTTGRSRGRYSALVVGQVAVALSLLTGAGLLIRAAAQIRGFNFGFDPSPLLSVQVNRDSRADSIPGTNLAFFNTLEQRLSAVPRVKALAWMSPSAADNKHVTADLASGRARTLPLRGGYFRASRSLLGTMGIRLVAGRDFDASDELGGGAAIVDEVMARRLWRNESPIGRMIKLGDAPSARPWIRVIGVAARAEFNMHTEAYDEDAFEGSIYVASPELPSYRTFVLRALPADQSFVWLDIERLLRDALGPRPSFLLTRWSERYTDLVTTQEFLSRLFSGFGVVALFLCALGLYSVLSYAVSRRAREYGIRMAIGAQRSHVFRDVVREGAVLVFAGTALGGFTSMWTNTFVDRYTYNMYHIDALTLVAAEVLLVAVALVASVAPAVRATRANPVDVLRAS